MIVKLFKPRFAPLVEKHIKRNTIRPRPKRLPKVGDRISLRQWTGLPYRSKQRILLESIVTHVDDIRIDKALLMGCFIWVSRIMLSFKEASDLARADGFGDLQDMATWFEREHGLPFEGIIIYWE